MDIYLGVAIIIAVLLIIISLTVYSTRIINRIAENKYSNIREIMYGEERERDKKSTRHG